LTDSNKTEIGKVVLSFPELDSTNEYALKVLSKTRPIEGTVIITDFQTAGKGQIGSKWESERGKNLTLTCIIYPNFLDLIQQFLLTCIASLSVRQTIASILDHRDVKIKWPNDILVDQKKICGILIQNSVMAGKIQNSVIGIGINVNQSFFSQDLTFATSLINELNYEIGLENIKTELFSNLTRWYNLLKDNQIELIKNSYTDSLYGREEEKIFLLKSEGKEKPGIIKGIDPRGKLWVEHEGKEAVYDIKEIQYQ
jgi:BirA family transcriptional regulator, biotin operon repressor / biotin---[acetyl-CoA-carboxylase] ligase